MTLEHVAFSIVGVLGLTLLSVQGWALKTLREIEISARSTRQKLDNYVNYPNDAFDLERRIIVEVIRELTPKFEEIRIDLKQSHDALLKCMCGKDL